MSQTATIKSLPRAFRMMKAMEADGVVWGADYRGLEVGSRGADGGRC
jgi:hypothetical protein